MIEQNYPILYIQQELHTDGVGSGRWDGAPSVKTIIRTLNDPVTFVYMGDGHQNPARGAAGGFDGIPARALICKIKNGIETEVVKELPTINEVTVKPGEAICGICSSGGGYGDPLDRDPEMVKHRAREGWITVDQAREVYGVVIDTGSELYGVDWKATEELREKMKKERGAL